MGTLLDLASLVVVPSGYKEDVVYSVKPTDGSGDLDFTRSNDTATRVNSAGLIEKVRTNLILQSEEFDNAYWQKGRISVTANTETSPIGTTTADTIIDTAESGTHRIFTSNISVVSGTAYATSCFVKAGTSNRVEIRLLSSVEGNIGIDATVFDLSTGTIVSGSGSIENFGNGWFRCTNLGTSNTTGNASAFIYLYNSANERSYLGTTTNTFFLWGAQTEVSDFGATDYIPTTTTAVSVGMTANVPRLDYTGGGCPKLLLEPQRTNLALYSENFDNAYWTKDKVTVTPNNAVAPDGTTSADLVFPNANGTADFEVAITRFTSGLSSETRTISLFVKPSGWQWVYLLDAGGAGRVWFDLQNGVVGTQQSGSTGKIITLSNGWYRIDVTRNNAQGAFYYFIGFSNADNSTVCTASGTSGVYFYGAQLEAGSYATSYIPTLGAAVTRGADACSKTGISSLIGQTEGTIYWEGIIDALHTDNTFIGIEKASSNFVIRLGSSTSNLYAQVYNGSTNLFLNTITYTLGSFVKIAIAYKNGDYALYKDGVQLAVAATAGAVPTCDAIAFNNLWGGGTPDGRNRNSQALLFPTRLTNTQLAELTTL